MEEKEQIKCPHCGTWNPAEREECRNCTRPLEEEKYRVTQDDQRKESAEGPAMQLNPKDSEGKKTKKRVTNVGMFVFFLLACIVAIIAMIAGF